MSAADHLSQQQFYHVAPDFAHDDISSHGLDHTRGEPSYPGMDYPRGNYLFTKAGPAQEYAHIREREEQDEYGPEAAKYNVYHVEHSGPVHRDPFHDDESGLGKHSVYTPEPIPASRIRRL